MAGTEPAMSEAPWGHASLHCADDGCVCWTAAAASPPVGLMQGRRQRDAARQDCCLRCADDVHAGLANCRHGPSV